MSTDNRIHFVPPVSAIKLISENALCGTPWQRITDIPAKVTCPDCLKKINEDKK
jgi:hypothetical protein